MKTRLILGDIRGRFVPLALLGVIAMTGVLAGCDEREYPSDKADELRRAERGNLKDYYASMSAADRAAVSTAMTPTAAAVDADFMRGVDASMVAALEDAGIVYYDEAGNARDFFAILRESGVNWVRLRIWNEPKYEPTSQKGECDGGNNLAVTLRLARRVKAAGLKLLLDFHYSDRWADPSHQQIPAMWDNITTSTAMAQAITDYTTDVLTVLKNAGCAPDMVQIGNEITGGMLLKHTDGETDAESGIIGTGNNLKTYLSAGSAAVKNVLPQCKVMIHIEKATTAAAAFYGTTINGVSYDVIGLSWYPFYSSHGTLAALKTCISDLRTAHSDKQVVIAENGYPWTMWNSADDWGFDTLNDMVGWTGDSNVANAKTNLAIDASGTLPTGMTESTEHTGCVDATIRNQACEIRAVIDTAATAGAVGYFYWGGDWVTWGKGTRYAGTIYSNHENQALFGLDHKVLPSMKVLGAHR